MYLVSAISKFSKISSLSSMRSASLCVSLEKPGKKGKDENLGKDLPYGKEALDINFRGHFFVSVQRLLFFVHSYRTS
jgi:hypothetical protein